MGISSSVITLNKSQVQSMFDTPILILPAPGVGNLIIVHRVTLVNNYANNTSFANGGEVVLQYGNSSGGNGINVLNGNWTAAFINNNFSCFSTITGAVNTIINGVSNNGLYLSNQTQSFSGGGINTTLSLNIWYSLIIGSV